MRVSERGRAQIAAEEGVVLRAYKDVAGVWTIGVGHTAAAGGIKPKAGMVITREEAMEQFSKDLARFEKRVTDTGAFRAQAPFDGAVSFDFNTGAIDRASWVKLYAKSAYAEAEKALKKWTRSGGRHVAGLATRRKREADLIFRGRYADHVKPEGEPRKASDKRTMAVDPTVEEAQEILTAKGFNPGAIDGWMGEKTRAAILEYQRAHPNLENDGILGPATMAQLRRDAAAMSKAVEGTGAGGLIAGVSAWFSGLPWEWVAAGVALACFAFVVWRYRDVFSRRMNTWFGREVA